jgi:formamidopyrimidine-DNA glycosylase
MEGPSLYLAAEQLIVFKGKTIRILTGNTKIGKEQLLNRKVLNIYAWRKVFVLRKNLKIHRRKFCPHCGTQVIREKTGRRQRWSYYCPVYQPLL